MSERSNYSHIYTPENINEFFTLYKKIPDALIYSGGTYILHNQKSTGISLPKNVLTIAKIEELKQIRRTERYLEIGAAASLSKILKTGKHLLPKLLSKAIEEIGPPARRNLATLGGNICVPERRMTSFPVLLLLDVRLELRKSGSARWLPIHKFISLKGEMDLAPGEILTRIRIPFRTWDKEVFRKTGNGSIFEENSLIFCGFAKTRKGLLSDFHFAFSFPDKKIIRNREIETLLSGRKLPIDKKSRESVTELFNENLKSHSSVINSFQKHSADNLLKWFISQLTKD